VALASPDDQHHAAASRRFGSLREDRRRLVTTNHVVGETYTTLRGRFGYAIAQQYLRQMRLSPSVQRVFVPEQWEDAAEALLARYEEQRFSYVDATSFITMEQLGLQDVFAYDQHFAIAGFTVLT
jgi:predicted nucleic acid-binding protein